MKRQDGKIFCAEGCHLQACKRAKPLFTEGLLSCKRTGKRTSVPLSVLGDKRSWVEMFCAERGPSGARADVAPSGKAGHFQSEQGGIYIYFTPKFAVNPSATQKDGRFFRDYPSENRPGGVRPPSEGLKCVNEDEVTGGIRWQALAPIAAPPMKAFRVPTSWGITTTPMARFAVWFTAAPGTPWTSHQRLPARVLEHSRKVFRAATSWDISMTAATTSMVFLQWQQLEHARRPAGYESPHLCQRRFRR